MMRDLNQLRKCIDEIDRELVALFEKRMACSAQVAEYKIEHDMPVLDEAREKALLRERAAYLENSELRADIYELFGCIMRLSRKRQAEILESGE